MDNRAQVGDMPFPYLLLVVAVVITLVVVSAVDSPEAREYEQASEDVVVHTGAEGVLHLLGITALVGVSSVVALGVRRLLSPWLEPEVSDE